MAKTKRLLSCHNCQRDEDPFADDVRYWIQADSRWLCSPCHSIILKAVTSDGTS